MNEFYNIERLNSDDNIGGSHRFLFINPDDIIADAEIIHNNVALPFNLQASASFYAADFTEMTLDFKETQENNKGNSYTQAILSGILPKDSADNIYLLFKMAKKGLVVIYYDNNGNARILGSKASPARLRRSTSHGNSKQLNATRFTITCINGLEGAPFYQSTVPSIFSCANTLSIQGLFQLNAPDLPDYTVSSDAVGTYPYLTTDGVSDPITISLDGIPATAPFVLTAGMVVSAIRLNTGAPGWYKLSQ